jgi:antirestriction protein ArdC
MAKKRTKSAAKRRDIYQEVTDRIIGYLEQGTTPWRNPIQRGTGDGWPKNLQSGKRYRGINVFLLGLTAWEHGYSSDFWMTFKQAEEQGGQVRRGEKGSLVTFFKMYSTKDKETGEPIEIPMLKHFTAFNAEQVEGIVIPDVTGADEASEAFEPLNAAEKIIDGYRNKPSIEFDGGRRAYYRPTTDTIHLPERERFDCRESFYSTLFHEAIHSTGNSKRLDRGLDTELAAFGSPDYSREELIAEMGAAFLCAASGISPSTIEQSAAYLRGWIEALKGDKRLVVTAASAAQKASDHILGVEIEAFPATDSRSGGRGESVAANESAIKSVKQHPSQLDLF